MTADCKHEFVYPSTGLCRECGESVAPRKRGPKRRYDSLTLLQMQVTPELRTWFEALPGHSNHERMQWLKDLMTGNPAHNPTLD